MLATPMRGLRFGLAMLFASVLTVALLPFASANPIVTMDYYLLDVPVFLVLVNFPLNGLVLLSMYSKAIDRSKAWRPASARAFIVDVSIVVLLFSSIGALIDLGVFGLTYENTASLLGIPIGLAAVFGSCIFVCVRYLGMTPNMAAGTGALVLVINFISWTGMIMSVDAFLFIYLPIVTVLWVVFEVMLVRRASRFGPGVPRPSATPSYPPPAYGQAPQDRDEVPTVMGMDDKLRTEAISWCIALLFLLVVLSLYGFNDVIYT